MAQHASAQGETGMLVVDAVILLEAQHRWLRPAEICEILRNYKKFHITSEPPTRPPSMNINVYCGYS
ncbi:hypothetical protein GOBAR_AA00782 [Gossypium barbadense]|uniref:CG-1 domain-containing protein n=1 Tax=Gossypium barbadense TaxID=3634 RepID=A0A2P5YVZ8_GOSBA|nr:hypothetical protein GOBAR_AA00782 [Gossypium barbadense]